MTIHLHSTDGQSCHKQHQVRLHLSFSIIAEVPLAYVSLSVLSSHSCQEWVFLWVPASSTPQDLLAVSNSWMWCVFPQVTGCGHPCWSMRFLMRTSPIRKLRCSSSRTTALGSTFSIGGCMQPLCLLQFCPDVLQSSFTEVFWPWLCSTHYLLLRCSTYANGQEIHHMNTDSSLSTYYQSVRPGCSEHYMGMSTHMQGWCTTGKDTSSELHSSPLVREDTVKWSYWIHEPRTWHKEAFKPWNHLQWQYVALTSYQQHQCKSLQGGCWYLPRPHS